MYPRNIIKKKVEIFKMIRDIQAFNKMKSGQDVDIMFNEIINKKYKRVLELGTGYGHSTIILLVAVAMNRGKLITNDVKEIHMLDTWVKIYDCQFLLKSLIYNCGSDLNLNFRKKFDMIFLDTNHNYEHTKKELAKFSKLSDVIFCHDYTLGGVSRPIHEFLKENPEWKLKTFDTHMGLARLFKIKPSASTGKPMS